MRDKKGRAEGVGEEREGVCMYAWEFPRTRSRYPAIWTQFPPGSLAVRALAHNLPELLHAFEWFGRVQDALVKGAGEILGNFGESQRRDLGCFGMFA